MFKATFLSSLRREQREAVGLLCIGTFLEYFDLMLYIQMAIIINKYFFPVLDGRGENMLAAFAFCSIYLVRPLGALIFNRLANNIGRKTTVMITTLMVAASCILMANIPTYSKIGITAAWLVTICRMMQGIASMGETIWAELYLIEIRKPPAQYKIVALISIFASLGVSCALAVASLVTSPGFDWRVAFWIGAAIALIGSVARRTLRESTEFADTKKRAKYITSTDEQGTKKLPFITGMAFFLVQCGWPTCFYLAYIYFGNILKQHCGYTDAQVIQQNFIVSILNLLSYILLAYLSNKIYPMKILKFKVIGFMIFVFLSPLLLYYKSNPLFIMLMQSIIMLFILNTIPATSIFLKNFPVSERFSDSTIIYALSRAIMSVISSIGLLYFVDKFERWGIMMFILPIVIGYCFGIIHFENLEKVKCNKSKS